MQFNMMIVFEPCYHYPQFIQKINNFKLDFIIHPGGGGTTETYPIKHIVFFLCAFYIRKFI